jgi:hypothetical protein
MSKMEVFGFAGDTHSTQIDFTTNHLFKNLKNQINFADTFLAYGKSLFCTHQGSWIGRNLRGIFKSSDESQVASVQWVVHASAEFV